MRISVAMPCLNAMPHIKEAVDSAKIALAGEEFEIVVADGGSTDGTLDYLRSAGVKLLEGPDNSLYEGLNKAVTAARGDHVVWLNSDDLLCPEIMELVQLARSSGADLATGEVQTVTDGKVVWESAHREARLDFTSVLFGIPNINCRVISVKLLKAAGPFTTKVGLSADREMMLRLLDLAERRIALPKVVYRYDAHPASRTMGGTWKSYRSVHDSNLRLASHLRGTRPDNARVDVIEAYAALSSLALARAELFAGDWSAAVGTLVSAVGGHPSPGDWRRGLSLYRRYRGRGSGW